MHAVGVDRWATPKGRVCNDGAAVVAAASAMKVVNWSFMLLNDDGLDDAAQKAVAAI